MTKIMIEQIDDALATVAGLMQWPGGRGLAYLPIFERLEREREQMASLDNRLAMAIARAKGRPSPALWEWRVEHRDNGQSTIAGRAGQAMTKITIEQIDDALGTLARLMQAQGEHGLAYLPIFERLEREREQMASLNGRLARAVARVKGRF
ncbi:hypothetical protein [Mesorhizobium loti]|uniref:hypothetical protein n=1 Tax=Rhizobium loti TaxID=381 RepID=UPI00053BAA79|nr:hypothetical protein [Mesorhizobium loti]